MVRVVPERNGPGCRNQGGWGCGEGCAREKWPRVRNQGGWGCGEGCAPEKWPRVRNQGGWGSTGS